MTVRGRRGRQPAVADRPDPGRARRRDVRPARRRRRRADRRARADPRRPVRPAPAGARRRGARRGAGSSARYRVGTVGTRRRSGGSPRTPSTSSPLADGTWRVVQDLTDAPTGLGYAMLDRSAMLRVADEILGPAGPTRRRSPRSPGRRPSCATRWRPHDRAEPAHRAVLRRRRPPGVRRALLARPVARVPRSSSGPTSSCARAGCGCGPSAASTRSTWCTGGSRTTASTRSRSSSTGGAGVPGLLHGRGERRRRARQRARFRGHRGSGARRLWPDAAEALTGMSFRLPPIGDAARPSGSPRCRRSATASWVRARSSCGCMPSPGRTASRSCRRQRSGARARRRPAPPDGAPRQGRVGDRRRRRTLPLIVAPRCRRSTSPIGADPGRRRTVLGRSGRRAGGGDRPDVASRVRSSPAGPDARRRSKVALVARA